MRKNEDRGIRSTIRRLSIAGLLFLGGLAANAAAGAALTIGVSTTSLSTPFYVAERQGFFAQEGLDVSIVDCSGGKKCMQMMLAGEVQFATASDLPIMFNSFEHKDFAVLGTFATTTRGVKLIALKNSGIGSVQHLPGKRVALTRGAAGEYFVDLVMLTYGLDPKSLNVIDATADRMEALARAGQADVLVGFEPGSFKLMRALKGDALTLDVPAIYTLSFNLVSLKATARERERDVLRLLRALDRAVQFIHSRTPKAQAILLERLKLDADFIGVGWAEMRFGLSLNQSLLTTLESEARWALRENVVKSGARPNYLDIIDPSYLLKVKPAAVTLVK